MRAFCEYLAVSSVLISWGTPAAAAETPPPEQQPRAPSTRVTLALGGDVQLGRYVSGSLRRHCDDQPLAAITDLLGAADLALVNLENPVSDRDPKDIVNDPKPKKYSYRLRAPTSALPGLKSAGIDVVSVANNHSADLGREGTAETVAALDQIGLAHAGIAVEGDPFAPVAVPVGDTRIHVFAATTFMNRQLPQPSPVALMSLDALATELGARVHALRQQRPNELILVSLHWGIENAKSPWDKHREVAHALIDAGANVVMGHHSHVLQPIEIYEGGVVFYSLGNLLFDMPETEARRSVVAEVVLERVAANDASWRATGVTLTAVVRIPKSDGPRPATAREAAPLFARVLGESRRRFATTFAVEGNHALWRGAD